MRFCTGAASAHMPQQQTRLEKAHCFIRLGAAWIGAAVLPLTSLLSFSGCTVLPAVEFHASDGEGSPLVGVPVTITSSSHLELVCFHSDMSAGEVREVSEEERHRVDDKTGENGVFHLAYIPPSRSGVLARLFGADELESQWIAVAYKDATGGTFTYKVFVVPD